jgi:hypothetical protein
MPKNARQAAYPTVAFVASAIAPQERGRRDRVAEHEQRVDGIAGNAERRIAVDRRQAREKTSTRSAVLEATTAG